MLTVLPLIYFMVYLIILLFLIVFAFLVKKYTCRGAVQCKWTDLCDGRAQQHYCIFQPMAHHRASIRKTFRRLFRHLYGRGQRPPPDILSIRNYYFTENRRCIQGRPSFSSRVSVTIFFASVFFMNHLSPSP